MDFFKKDCSVPSLLHVLDRGLLRVLGAAQYKSL